MITEWLEIIGADQAPSEARGVVIGGKKYEESCRDSLIDSEMAGPISLKLSGIDRGNSESVLGRVRGGMIQDSWFMAPYWEHERSGVWLGFSGRIQE